MSVEDKRIYRLLEHELHRYQSLDISNMTLGVIRGVGYIGGIIRPAVGMYNLNMKDEMRIILENTRRVPGLRDLIIDAKIETSPIR